uniref:Uncharacterized protein n=1 Tax=Panagrellus redivivus TaxID=6233 RepID=A0A7E4VXN8_PANRE
MARHLQRHPFRQIEAIFYANLVLKCPKVKQDPRRPVCGFVFFSAQFSKNKYFFLTLDDGPPPPPASAIIGSGIFAHAGPAGADSD